MTIKEFAQEKNVLDSTVRAWCDKHLIRGAKLDEKTGQYDIPSSAKVPYTQNRAYKGDKIYISIVRAIMNEFDVCAKLYKIHEDEFEGYIDDLVETGIIAKYIAKDTGIEYYRQTLKSSEFSKLPINKIKAFLIEAKKIVSVNLSK